MIEDEVKKFWDDQANAHGAGQQATNEDTYYRSLEIREIIKHLGNDPGHYVLDVGCGNGFSTTKFATHFPLSFFTGIDFSEAMIAQANMHEWQNIFFRKENVLDLTNMRVDYDTIISERCLINITNYQKQKQAVLQMKRVLRRQGRMIIVENTLEGLSRLNRLRKRIGLHEIKMRWHNLYLPHDVFFAFLKDNFEHCESHNIGTPYYLLSRVLYAKYCQMRGIEPRYDNLINKIACKLPSIPGWWMSPNHMFIVSRKKP